MYVAQVRVIACWCCLAVASLTTSLMAQPQPGQPPGGPGRGFGGMGFGGPGGLGLLQREDVQEELELLDDQKTQIRELQEKSRERMGEVFRGFRGGDSGGDRRDELRDTFRKFNEETQAELEKILLPHQAKRLKQLEVQMRMRGGVMGALGGDVAEQIGLTEDQTEKLRDKARELEQEMRKKLTELRKQMQDQLLAELGPDQREKFNELVGEPFEFRDEAPGQFGGPAGFRQRGEGGREGGDRGNDRRRRPDGEQ